MANFFFFTDIDKLDTQTLPQSYGSLGNLSNKDRYRVTSLHTASSDTNAIAISNAVVLAQEIPGTSLVNLILKPLSKPTEISGRIKFFIYKGIKRDSLFNGNIIAIRSTNDLTETIWKSHEARNKSITDSANDAGVAVPTLDVSPSQEALGIQFKANGIDDLKIIDTDTIESLFFNNSDENQYPIVRSGWVIGEFDHNGFGLEIVFENIGFEATLGSARNIENIIEVDQLPTSPTSLQILTHWNKKEVILNYMDPASFFGSFYTGSLRLNKVTDTERLKEEEIYDEVIVKFFKKNTVYLDIRNENNQSYDFYMNYGKDIQLAFDESSALQTTNFYASNWPILELDNTDFVTGNTTKRNLLRIALPKGDNTLPLIFVSQGFINRGGANSFPRVLSGNRKFVELERIANNSFVNDITMALPNNAENGNTTVVASYIKLRYVKGFETRDLVTPPSSPPSTILNSNPLDNIFVPFQMDIPFTGTPKVKYKVYDEEAYIDQRSTNGLEFVTSVGFAEDVDNITFFAFAREKRTGKGARNTKGFSLSSETSNEQDYFLNLVASKHNTTQLIETEFDLPSGDLVDVPIIENNNSNSFLRFTDTDGDELIGFTIAKSELDTLNTIATSSGLLTNFKIFLGLTNRVNDVDTNGNKFTSFDLVLRGFEETTGDITVSDVSTNLKVFINGTI